MAKKKSNSEAVEKQGVAAQEVLRAGGVGGAAENRAEASGVGGNAGECAQSVPMATTGEVDISEQDTGCRDAQILSRLRAGILPMPEVYREAQIFDVQALNTVAMLTSGEHDLVVNTLEILRILERYVEEGVGCLFDGDADIRERAERYVLQCMRGADAPVVEMVDGLVARCRKDGAGCARLANFIDRVRLLLMNQIVQGTGDVASHQTALMRLCAVVDIRTIERVLCDPAPEIRIAAVRSLAGKMPLDIHTISVLLILLKDRNEKVNLAIMDICGRLKTYPELVVPQILPLFPAADDALHEGIADVLRSYGNSVVDPVMTLLEDTSESMAEAVKMAISVSPQRYTDALLKALQSARTRDYVKDRICAILRAHDDGARRGEISAALKMFEAPLPSEYPEWRPPKKPGDAFLDRALNDASFYKEIWSDTQIAAMAASCPEETLIRLMSDASPCAQLNAFHIMAKRGLASAVAVEQIAVWMKSSREDVAYAALLAWFGVVKDQDAAAEGFIDALSRCASDAVAEKFLASAITRPDLVKALFRAYFKQPRKCLHVVGYILNNMPSKDAVDDFLCGIDRSQSVACIAETLGILSKKKLDFDNRKIRPALVGLLRDPVSFGQHGFMTRWLSLKLLGRYLLADKEPDRATISEIQAFQKEGKNAELRNLAKETLRALGEEIFDLEDEEDDFEDLEDEDERF